MVEKRADEGPSFKKGEAPAQPTVHVQQPPKADTKTIRTNDPVTNQAEKQLAEKELEGPEREEQERLIKEQEEEAKRQQELADQRRQLMQDVIKSNEGFIKREEGNAEAVDDAWREGLLYSETVQSGPGGLEVEERFFVTSQGYENLRSVFGQNMGVQK